MKIHLVEKILRRTLTLIPFILGSSIVVLSCNIAPIFQTNTSTPTSAPTLTASPARPPLPPSMETPTLGPSALQLQAVLNAVATKLSQCRDIRNNNNLPMVMIEHRPEGPSASFHCRRTADSGYFVSISSSDQEAIPADQFSTERTNNDGKCFHGYVLYEESSRHSRRKYAVRDVQEWHTQRWIVLVRAFYDSGYPHYQAQEVSDAVYTFGVEQGLFPAGTCP